MLRKFKFILISLASFLILSLNTLKAEMVTSIKIDGNNRVSDETIIIYGNINLNEDINESKLNQILNDLYSTNFFENIKVKIDGQTLIINLKEYPVVNQILLIGEKSTRVKEQIKKVIKLKEKKSFIKSSLSKDIDLMKKLYSSIGFNFSKIEAKINKISDGNLDLIFEIEKGKKTKISSIKFIGDKKVKDKRLRDLIASEEDKFWKVISNNTNFTQNLINLDLRLLTNYYKSIGYYDVKINSNSAEINNEANVDLLYSINAGPRYTINKISTNLDPVFDKKLFFNLNKSYQKLIGEYHSPFKIKKLLEEIDELIEKNNLQFVEHNVEETLGDSTIAIKFNIYEGERKLVERINITGNNVTNEAVIRGELLLDEGDPFTNLNLEKSIAKIKSRNIFNSVKKTIKNGSTNDLKIIDIAVEEKPTGEISAGAGVGTTGGSFAINISENNWMGKGNKINFQIEADKESLTGLINYTNPNYDFLGNSLNYYVSSRSNDKPDQGYENTVFSAGANTSFEQYKDIYVDLGLAASYDDLRASGSASKSLKKQSGEFSELSANYGARKDTRNRAFMPTKGSVVSFNQSVPIYADKKFIANTFKSSFYSQVTENVIGVGKFKVSAINGIDDDVRLSKRRSLSGKDLRGFKKGKIGPKDGTDHIGGNYATSLNFEASLPNLLPEATKTDVALFLDFGNVWGVDYDSSIDASNKIRSATGAAASWISPLGPMTFVLSTNLSKAGTDETESFNFNLGTTF